MVGSRNTLLYLGGFVNAEGVDRLLPKDSWDGLRRDHVLREDRTVQITDGWRLCSIMYLYMYCLTLA